MEVEDMNQTLHLGDTQIDGASLERLVVRHPLENLDAMEPRRGLVAVVSVLFGLLSALINLPIVEAPVTRPGAQPA